MPDATLPEPIRTTSEVERILKGLDDLHRAIVQLHPILDLLDPTSDQEGHGMILRLSRLLTAVEDRLVADQAERASLIERLDRQDAKLATMETMISDLHGILTLPIED